MIFQVTNNNELFQQVVVLFIFFPTSILILIISIFIYTTVEYAFLNQHAEGRNPAVTVTVTVKKVDG